MESPFFWKADLWIEKILSHPGMDRDELALRKVYWLASGTCAFFIITLVTIFKVLNPELKILFAYGLIVGFLFLEWIIELPLFYYNIEKRMFINQVFLTLLSFATIIMLGGIPHSGGLVFVGFFVVLFSLDFKSRRYSVFLFILYLVTLILAGVLHPFLSIAPEMTPVVNIYLWVINLLWISSLCFAFIHNFVRERVKIEKREAERLKELDRAKTSLYSNISHEFRTPLTVILGMSELIREQPEKWMKDGTEKIENSARILLHHTNQMLELSRVEASALPVQMVRGNTVAYISGVVELFQSLAASKSIWLDFRTEMDEEIMDYDPELMLTILSNLISNALKYTPAGGSVRVNLHRELKPSPILVAEVRDNGSGIPEKELPHIFSRFYRVERDKEKSVEGSGLGLALTRQLLKLLGGTISVKSEEGKGSTFRATFPITRKADPVNEERLQSDLDMIIPFIAGSGQASGELRNCPAEGTRGKSLLLLVEDNEDVILYLENLLKDQYTLQKAYSGIQGLELARKCVPDIILSDIMMPEMDGITMLEALKGDLRTSHIPVVMLTARADVASRLEGLERGADAYLPKPFNRRELEIILRKLVESRARLQERYAGIAGFKPSVDPGMTREDQFMAKVREYMQQCLADEDFDVQALCRTMAMSRSQFYRKFSSLTSKTLGDYLRSMRLHAAREILVSTRCHVSEAAYRTGFKNLSHFSRVFKKEFGESPGAIRLSSHPELS